MIKTQPFKQTIEQAIKSDDAYTAASNVIADYCARATNQLKNQRILVDFVKAVVKSGKKNKSDEKLRALKLLNKAIMNADQNQEFLRYTQKKILKRLAILAMYCPKGLKVDDCDNLLNRGECIFMQDESDKHSAAAFLIVLLDCIEKWAEKYKRDPLNGEQTLFQRSFQELVKEKVSFPSTAKRQQEKAEAAKVSAVPAKLIQQSKIPEQQIAKPVVSAHKDNSKAIKSVKWAADLKVQMRQVRDVSKQSENYLQLLEQQNFCLTSAKEHQTALYVFESTLELCENCIQQLMSDQCSQSISNHESLLEKMFNYQEQIKTCIDLGRSVEIRLPEPEIPKTKPKRGFNAEENKKVKGSKKITQKSEIPPIADVGEPQMQIQSLSEIKVRHPQEATNQFTSQAFQSIQHSPEMEDCEVGHLNEISSGASSAIKQLQNHKSLAKVSLPGTNQQVEQWQIPTMSPSLENKLLHSPQPNLQQLKQQVRSFQLEEDKQEWIFQEQQPAQDQERPQFHANDFLTMLSTIEFQPESQSRNLAHNFNLEPHSNQSSSSFKFDFSQNLPAPQSMPAAEFFLDFPNYSLSNEDPSSAYRPFDTVDPLALIAQLQKNMGRNGLDSTGQNPIEQVDLNQALFSNQIPAVQVQNEHQVKIRYQARYDDDDPFAGAINFAEELLKVEISEPQPMQFKPVSSDNYNIEDIQVVQQQIQIPPQTQPAILSLGQLLARPQSQRSLHQSFEMAQELVREVRHSYQPEIQNNRISQLSNQDRHKNSEGSPSQHIDQQILDQGLLVSEISVEYFQEFVVSKPMSETGKVQNFNIEIHEINQPEPDQNIKENLALNFQDNTFAIQPDQLLESSVYVNLPSSFLPQAVAASSDQSDLGGDLHNRKTHPTLSLQVFQQAQRTSIPSRDVLSGLGQFKESSPVQDVFQDEGFVKRQESQSRLSVNRSSSPFFSFNRPETPPDDSEEPNLFAEESHEIQTVQPVFGKDPAVSPNGNVIVLSPEPKVNTFLEFHSGKKPDFQFPMSQAAEVKPDFEFNSKQETKIPEKKKSIWVAEDDDGVMVNFLINDNLFEKFNANQDSAVQSNIKQEQIEALGLQIQELKDENSRLKLDRQREFKPDQAQDKLQLSGELEKCREMIIMHQERAQDFAATLNIQSARISDLLKQAKVVKEYHEAAITELKTQNAKMQSQNSALTLQLVNQTQQHLASTANLKFELEQLQQMPIQQLKESQSAAQPVERRISLKSDSSLTKSLTVKKSSSSHSPSQEHNSTPIILKKASLHLLVPSLSKPKGSDDMLGMPDAPPNKPKEEIPKDSSQSNSYFDF